MNRYKKLAIAISIGMLLYLCIYVCVLPQVAENSMANFRVRYGASRQEVVALGNLYGVEPHEFSNFGKGAFPVNYIEYMLDAECAGSVRRVVYRSEVESLVRGYVSRCDVDDSTVFYLFYSNWLSKGNIFHGEALIVEVFYRESGTDGEQILEHVSSPSIGDSGWPDRRYWENVAPKCNPPARYADCKVRLPVVGYFDR